jgi:tetratricopeptide (TPR) repeat protein
MYIEQFQAMNEGEHEEAIRIMEKLVAEYPEEKEALLTLGGYYKSIRLDQAKAAEYYLRAIEVDPMYKNAYNMMAYNYNDMGDFERMLWAINKYVELAPDEANPYDSRGDLLARNGRIDEAIESYRRAIEIKPDFYYSVQKLGHMYLYKQDYDKAAEYYSRLSASSSQNWRTVGRECIALIFMQQGKFKKALEAIDAAITADRMELAGKTRRPQKFFQKSRIYMEEGDLDSAISEYEAGMKINAELEPENTVSRRDLYVYLLLLAGRTEEADAVFDKLVKDLREEGPLYEVAVLLATALKEHATGNSEAAAQHAIQAFDSIPNSRKSADFGARYFLAMVLLDAGRLSEAVRELEDMLTVYDEKRAPLPIWSVKCHFLLAKAYEMSGWNDKAIEQYETFLDIWSDADQGIPALDEARERLANLKRAS